MITQWTNKRYTAWLGLSVALAAVTLLALSVLLTSTSLAAPLAEGLARPLNTNVSGVITQSTTWDVGGSPYVLTSDVTVNPGVTLTIAPGVIVQGGDNVELKVQGDLQALGIPGQPITFTSVSDSGGGQWAGLVFDGGAGRLRYATVRYGGGTTSAGIYSNITVQDVLAGEVILENCQVNNSRNVVRTEYGLYINNGQVTVSATLFSSNGNGGAAAPLYIAGASSVVTLTDNSFIGNSRDRIVLAPDAMMGHDTTLTPQTLLQGYELKNDFTVPPTVTLTLEPGVTIMGGDLIELKVQGHLQALGTPGQPITFTSVSDSGGGQWAGLVFDGGTGRLRHATVRYGGGTTSAGTYSNITVQDVLAGEVILENCQVNDSRNVRKTEYGLYINNSRVTVHATIFSDNGNGGAAAPLYIAGASSVITMTGNSFIGNLPRDRILLAAGAMMGHDTSLTPQTVPYELAKDYTVPSTVTLTLEPGVTLMGGDGIELRVQGDLQALGTPGQPITFTSVADSGGGQWAGLVFDGGSGHLRHATLRYGGAGNSAGTYSNITVQDALAGEIILENCQVNDSRHGTKTEYGLYINNGQVSVSNTLFSGNGNGGAAAPLYIAGASSIVTMTENSFIGNLPRDRILLAPGAMMGHDTTLTPQTLLQGYELKSDFTVPSTVTLTIEPGVTIMGHDGTELIVQGDLQALGTPEQPITFTSVANSGGCQWAGIVFDGGTGHLRYATARYGGAGNSTGIYSNITVQNTLAGEVILENCQVNDSRHATKTEYGLYINNGQVTVSATLFSSNGNGGAAAPLYIAGPNSVVAMADNIFTGNLPRDRIVLADSAMTGPGTALTPQTVHYELINDFTVPPTSTLTIEPGVTLMGGENIELKVQGHLQALGTPALPITFTSVTDSGGGQWSGLVFEGGTGHLRHAMVRFGGNGNSAGGKSNITVQNTLAGEVFLESCQVHNSGGGGADYGLYINNGRVSINDTSITGSDSQLYVLGDSTVLVDDGSVIEGATSHGVLIEGDQAWVHIAKSSILSNGAFSGDGVRNTGEATVILSGDPEEGNFIAYNQNYGANQTGLTGQIIATYNYWGDPSGPTHTGNPGGIGEEVSDRVLYDPWLTEVPTATLSAKNLVQAVGPRYVSPGETVNLGFIVHNVLTETLENTVLVAYLPEEVEYLLSSSNSNYWDQRHQVVWKLGDIAPGEVLQLGMQVRYQWGLPAHLKLHIRGRVSADNLQNPLIEHDLYAAYEPVIVTERVQLSQSELDAELAADSDLNALVDQALADGFTFFGNAYTVTQSTGDEHLAIVFLPDLAHYGETLSVIRMDGWSHILRSTPNSILTYDLDGGYELDLETRQHQFWGSWAEHNGLASCMAEGTHLLHDCVVDETTCLHNCLIQKLGTDAIQILVPLYGAVSTAGDCISCASSGFTDPENCGSCGANIAEELGYEYLSLFNDLHFCSWNCRYNDDFQEEQVCTESEQWCSTGYMPIFGYMPVVMQRECDPINCVWLYGETYKDWCWSDEICIQSPTIPAQCCNPLFDPLCSCIGKVCDDNPHEVLTAGDPNAMYGPMAATPGETISYSIECENVGEGTAYGVYIESALPEGLDDSTLEIGGNGVYFPGSRKMLWKIGELAPSAGDHVTFTVQISAAVVSDTVLIANATVYFPSVPETTPTNDVVTIVGDVVGHPQWVEIDEGAPISITLTGSSPTGNPLSYELGHEPLNGALSGAAPDLTYTPADNFEGLDSFNFQVNDGLHTSLPAEVTIQVNSGAETTPPEVLFTTPRDGVTDVWVYETPVYTDTYYPTIWAQFTEPISDTTMTTDTMFLMDAQGRRLSGKVFYNDTINVARFFLSEPLARMKTYTATLTTGIYDTSGNPLAADYVWSFSAEFYQVYLPVVLRNYH